MMLQTRSNLKDFKVNSWFPRRRKSFLDFNTFVTTLCYGYHAEWPTPLGFTHGSDMPGPQPR